MPNHIEITIKIPHVSEEEFYNIVNRYSSVREDWWGKDSLQIDFNKIIPSSSGADWYEAHCNDWGTKWNAMLSNFSWSNNTGVIYIETAWTTPDPILEKIVEDDWQVTYRDELWGQNSLSEVWKKGTT